MSLRAKLVSALGVLLAVGPAGIRRRHVHPVFGSSEYRRLDDRLRSSAPAAERYLHGVAGLDPGGGPGDQDGPDSRSLGIGSYAELRDANGQVLAQSQTTNVPDVPSGIPAIDQPFTVGSAVGTGDWRVLATPDSRYHGNIVIVANPLTDIADSLQGLIIIEMIAGAVLLALLTVGSWLILRRGLRPLEDMAVAAGSIHEGDMSVRVTPSDGRGEVGQLGLALNSMLDNLQDSVRRPEGVGGQVAPVPGRRVARAANTADVDPRFCRVVPPRCRQ